MATASYFVSRALTRLGIRASETSLQADEIQDGIYLLNDMMSEWEEAGPQLGFSPVAGVSDEIRIPRGANAAVIDNLAIRMAPEYSRFVSPALAKSADDGLKNLLNANITIGDVDMPGTLPLGSGNQFCDNDLDDRRFFPEGKKRNF
jgi:hypothetical protein